MSNFECNQKQVFEKSFQYMGSTLNISEDIAQIAICQSEILSAGFKAAQDYIRSFKIITKDFNKFQRFFDNNLVDVADELFDYHKKAGLNKAIEIIKAQGITDKCDLDNAYEFITEYIYTTIESAIRFYYKHVDYSASIGLNNNQLSIMAYKIYKIYIDIGRAIKVYLAKKLSLTFPEPTNEEHSFYICCRNYINTNAIQRGDRTYIKKFLGFILNRCNLIEPYCIVYHMYGDPNGELEEIAEFFGLRQEFLRCKNSYNIEEGLSEGLLFSNETNANYTPINWETFGLSEAVFYEFFKKMDVPDKRDFDAFIVNSAPNMRERLYYSKIDLLKNVCPNEDLFDSWKVWWAATALLSMYYEELNQNEFTEWASNNHIKLKESLIEYYSLVQKKIYHDDSEKKVVDSEKNNSSFSMELDSETLNKKKIDRAIVDNAIADVWEEIKKGNAYAEYALESYYREKCQRSIDSYNISEMHSILGDIINRSKKGDLCASYIFARLTFEINSKDRRNLTVAREASDLILKLSECGNISAITQRGFWGIHGYYNATANEAEGVKLLQIGANHHHPVALAWLGSCYRTGKSVQIRDLNKAREYLELAAMFGQTYAVEELKKLNNGNTSSGSCFITSAVCGSFGKYDDCYELEMFRDFRDKWLINQSDGKELIAEYYNIAPKIVKEIDQCFNPEYVYEQLWNEYLERCLKLIESKQFIECKELYMRMVFNLKNKYLLSN